MSIRLINNNDIQTSNLRRFEKQTRWTGYNISGLESGSHSTPGIAGVNYPSKIDRKYAQWFKDNGIKTVRLPFMLERLIPAIGKGIDESYSKIISDFCKECYNLGIEVFLDIHNYGAYYFDPLGGVSGNFAVANTLNIFDPRYLVVANKLQLRNPTNINAISSYEIVVAGNPYNPQLPSAGYKFTTNLEMVNSGTNPWESLQVVGMFIDNNNYYFVELNRNINIVKVYKRIAGVETLLGSYPYQVVLNTPINVVMDINQGSVGNIVVSINGSVAVTAPHDPILSRGKIGYKTQGSVANISSYELNIAGDITTGAVGRGNVFWGQSIGSSQYNVALHEYFYKTVFDTFDSLPGVIGYMYNEPHDVSVETTPANYKTTSTTTIFQQAALNKLRELGSEKWFGWTSDNWGGVQNMTQSITGPTKWGANFDLPWTDPLEKTFLDFHYYPDNYVSSPYKNSGTYGTIDGATPVPYTDLEIRIQVETFLKRLKTINEDRLIAGKMPVPFCLSETGVPESPTWIPKLELILSILQAYNAGFMYFGIGKYLGNDLNNIAADVDNPVTINGVSVTSLTKYQDRHKTINKYINKSHF